MDPDSVLSPEADTTPNAMPLLDEDADKNDVCMDWNINDVISPMEYDTITVDTYDTIEGDDEDDEEYQEYKLQERLKANTNVADEQDELYIHQPTENSNDYPNDNQIVDANVNEIQLNDVGK